MTTGFVFDIKRFSIHDGPGIRTTVFLKGCPLSCLWCHNPESQAQTPELILYPDRCIYCGACIIACQNDAISNQEGSIITDRSLCKVSGDCVEVCFSGAREIVGKDMSATDVILEVVKDRPFFDQSGGGVTFSGGEPFQQTDFLEECLRLSKGEGLHTVVDTCGYTSWESMSRMMDHIDLLLYDVKIIDNLHHLRNTGVDNKLIFDNLSAIIKAGKEVYIRYPVIPGLNDSMDSIKILGKLLENLKGIKRVDLLPYHGLSGVKYRRLDRPYQLEDVKTPSKERLQDIQNYLSNLGLEVVIEG
jgi:pyruvate formate lyase activating enzyme